MKAQCSLFMLFLFVVQLHAQDYVPASSFHGKVKSFEERSYKAHLRGGNVVKGRSAHEYGGDRDFMYEYDSLGRITSRTWIHKRSKLPYRSLHFSYDSSGNLLQVRLYQSSKGLTSISNYEYMFDDSGRMTFRTWRRENSGEVYRVKFTYDEKGYITETLITDSLRPENGLKLRLMDSHWNVLQQWDYNGSRLSIFIESSYDSLYNKTEERWYNKRGKLVLTYRWKYSATNELIRYENCRKNDRSCESWTYKYEYDKKGNWIKRVDYRNGKARFLKERTISYWN